MSSPAGEGRSLYFNPIWMTDIAETITYSLRH